MNAESQLSFKFSASFLFFFFFLFYFISFIFISFYFFIRFRHLLLKKMLRDISFTVKILKFGTPQTIAIIVLKIEKFDVTLH